MSAHSDNVVVVDGANDAFEAYRDQYPWIEDRRVPLMIIKGQVELYEDSLQRGEA